MTQKAPSPIDKHVASRIRQRRLQLGMSQEELALALNVTFQQVQKYEKGTNRISAGRLHEIAAILSMPLQFFYEGCSETVGCKKHEGDLELARLMALPEVVSLIQALARFKNPKILQLMSALAVAVTEEIADSSCPEDVTRRSAPGR